MLMMVQKFHQLNTRLMLWSTEATANMTALQNPAKPTSHPTAGLSASTEVI